MTLKSRQIQIPHGFRFIQPEVRAWRPRPYTSFDSLVNQVIALRKGNQALLAKGLATDYPTVAAEVEQFNVRICQQMGWDSYLAGGEAAYAPPKPMALQQSDQKHVRAVAGVTKKIWSGIRTLSEWYESREPGVPREQAEKRAAVCVACPKNEKGDLTRWFTNIAAAAVQRQVEKFSSRQLTTSHDENLHTCAACLCVNRLSCHVPLKLKLANMSSEVRAELDPGCWILSEEKGEK